ncbi:helix-turn-helix domain-containing protein [Limosilactobacillus reuteri]|uniref:helix-turn-helix domain-containing protein n=1 Tax=Limosilactobacillus reuteri TaxID=1598 RepID=UPI001E2D083A|nr:helix-turn-helix domain-containing protein [Limosilactobacillus reuteri]MCC4518352.1 helix-turn-helix domain-containing protein [Limosilactobacillus reuteri]
MARLIKRTNDNYTNISNILARDKRLTWKARGIFLYMWSQADNWQFYVREIASHAVDGERALTSGLKELEKYGYLIRKHRIAKHGGFAGMDWILTDRPEINKTSEEHQPQNNIDDKKAENSEKNVQNVSDTKCTGYDLYPIQNSSLRNNNNKNYQQQEITKESNTNSASHSNAQSVSQLENEFEEVWSKYPNKKGKKQAFNHYKAWRKASAKHTNEYLLERLKKYLTYCQQNNWYHPMNGSTWFNGRFDDELEVDNPKPANKYEQEGYYDDYKDFVRDDGKGDNLLDGVSDDELPF